jgi:hypothetical protein
MAALKVLVVVMGIAIVGMVGLIGVTIAKRFQLTADGPMDVRLGLAAGEAIAGAVPGDDRLAVTVRDGQGGSRVVVLDLATGKPTHNILP